MNKSPRAPREIVETADQMGADELAELAAVDFGAYLAYVKAHNDALDAQLAAYHGRRPLEVSGGDAPRVSPGQNCVE